MNCLSNLNGCELVTFANIVAILISQGLTADELVALSGFFTIIGDSLSAISATCDNSSNCSSCNN